MTNPEINAKAMDVAIKVAAQKRLLAAMAEQRLIESAIERAAGQIAAGFSTDAAARDEERINLVRLSTWGEA